MFRPSVNPEVTTASLAVSPDIDKDRHCKTLLTLCQITTGHAGLENIKTIYQWPGGHRAAKTLVVWLLVWPQDSILWGCLIFKDTMKMVFTVKEVKLLSFPPGAEEAHSRSRISEMAQMPKKIQKDGRGHAFWVNIQQKAAPSGRYICLSAHCKCAVKSIQCLGWSLFHSIWLSLFSQPNTSAYFNSTFKTKCLGWFISSQWFPPIAFWNYNKNACLPMPGNLITMASVIYHWCWVSYLIQSD